MVLLLKGSSYNDEELAVVIGEKTKKETVIEIVDRYDRTCSLKEYLEEKLPKDCKISEVGTIFYD